MLQEKVGVVGRYHQSKDALAKFFVPLSSWNYPVKGVGYNPITKTETTPEDLKNEELQKDTDALLDEIDELLEEDCQAFIRSYIQRGGQ